MSLARDVTTLVEDPLLSVRVVAGTVTTRGLLDDQEVVSTDGLEPGQSFVVRERILHLSAAAVPGLARQQIITVGAIGDDTVLTACRVRDIRRTADGLVLEVSVVPI